MRSRTGGTYAAMPSERAATSSISTAREHPMNQQTQQLLDAQEAARAAWS